MYWLFITAWALRLRPRHWHAIVKVVQLNSTDGSNDIVTSSAKVVTGPGLFHFIVTTPDDSFCCRQRRAVESVLYHQPRAQVIIHSVAMTTKPLDVLRNYNVTVRPYDLEELKEEFLRRSGIDRADADRFFATLEKIKREPYWVVHESDLLRLLLLYLYGGTYLDTDVIVVQPMDYLQNVVAYEDDAAGSLNTAVMKFNKGNAFLQACITEFFATYDGESWGWNGPLLLDRVVRKMGCNEFLSSCPVTLLPQISFYPMTYPQVEGMCFLASGESQLQIGKSTYVVHLNNKITKKYTHSLNGTLCRWLLNDFCVETCDATC